MFNLFVYNINVIFLFIFSTIIVSNLFIRVSFVFFLILQTKTFVSQSSFLLFDIAISTNDFLRSNFKSLKTKFN